MPKNNKLSCSLVTQTRLGESLKELMENETFDKISISDITNNCDVHRQTFYYHFSDKFELLDWVVYNDIIKPLVTDFNFDDIGDRFLRMFTTMADNRKFYQNAVKINLDEMSKYISKIAYDQFLGIIYKVEKENKIEDATHEESALLAEFLGYGIVGIVFGWLTRGLKESPEVMATRIVNILESSKNLIIEKETESK